MSTGNKNGGSYFAIEGGLPGQRELMTGRAGFTDAYAGIPKGVMTDIVASLFPFWEKSRGWIIARPLSGFSETFSHYVMEVAPGGGSDKPEPEAGAEGALFVVSGSVTVTVGGAEHVLETGSFGFLPPSSGWTLRNNGSETAKFHWIRKMYEAVEGIDTPEPLFE